MAKTSVPAKKEGSGWSDRWNNIKSYMSGVYSELKKVHWPDRRQLTTYTAVVLIAVALVGFIIWLFDSGLGYALDRLLKAFPQ